MKLTKDNIWIPSALPFFLLGLIYYFITPYIAIFFFNDLELIKAANNHIDIEYFNIFYWLDTIAVFTSFFFGYVLANLTTKTKTLSIDTASSFTSSPFVVFLLLALFLLFIFFNYILGKGIVFSGYKFYNISILGPLTTVIFTAVIFLNFFKNKKIKKLFFLIYFVASVLLLGFGSRMFFLLATIAIILNYISLNPRLLKSSKLYIVVSILSLSVLLIGIWRSSYEFSIESMLSIFFAEPLFTATSGSTYFKNIGNRPLLNFPTDLIASFINFTPSFLFPDKLTLIKELTYNPNIHSPFGATALIVSLYSNFGILYPIYLFFIGFFYGFVRKMANKSKIYRAIYFSVLPLLMFNFYREGFITVTKVLFFNGFFLPLSIVLLIYIFFYKSNKNQPKDLRLESTRF